MANQHLFNSGGDWIAFRVERYVFNNLSDWIGWLPWEDEDVFTPNGDYLGTIVPGDRLYRFSNRPLRAPPLPPLPPLPPIPALPALRGGMLLPVGAENVDLSKP